MVKQKKEGPENSIQCSGQVIKIESKRHRSESILFVSIRSFESPKMLSRGSKICLHSPYGR